MGRARGIEIVATACSRGHLLARAAWPPAMPAAPASPTGRSSGAVWHSGGSHSIGARPARLPPFPQDNYSSGGLIVPRWSATRNNRIVDRMIADPEPLQLTTSFARQCSVVDRHGNGMELFSTLHLDRVDSASSGSED